MTTFSIDCWEDEERQREDDWRDAWDALDEEQEPPEDTCPACCGNGLTCCLVAAAVPGREGGSHDR